MKHTKEPWEEKWKMNTINKSFNEAWDRLAKIHGLTTHVANTLCLDIFRKPTKINWKWYLTDLLTVHGIGRRNSWVHTHVDGQGFPMWFTINKDIASGKDKGIPQHLNPEGIKELIEAAKRFSTKDIDGIQEPALFELVSSLQSALERCYND